MFMFLETVLNPQDLIPQANTISHLGTTAVHESKTLARTITGKKSKFQSCIKCHGF